jgi:uncharacterized protein (TIGR03067 family)
MIVSWHTDLAHNKASKTDRFVVKDDTIRPAVGEFFMHWIGPETEDCCYFRFRLDADSTPKQITLIPWTTTISRKTKAVIKDAAEDYTIKGIYEFKNGKLRVCVAKEGEDRPRSFSPREGHELWILERVSAEEEAKDSRQGASVE